MTTSPAHVEIRGPKSWWGGPFNAEHVAVHAVAHVVHGAGRVAAARGKSFKAFVQTDKIATNFGLWNALRRSSRSAGLGLTGFYRCADSWVHLHGEYPHHEGVLKDVLGVSSSADVARAVLGERALDVEAALTAAGGIAAAQRMPIEWASSLVGKAVRNTPLISITADGDRVALPPGGSAPLSGLKVVDVTRGLAGPTATTVLASLGAYVVRVDPPMLPELSYVDAAMNEGKVRVELGLGAEADVAAARDLLAKCDVAVLGYRPGALARFGLDAASVRRLNPAAIVASVSAWGVEGPFADRRGFAPTVETASGLSSLLAGPDGRPDALPFGMLSHTTGCHLAGAIMQALASRAEKGASRLSASLVRTAWELHQHPREEGDEGVELVCGDGGKNRTWDVPLSVL